MSTSSSSASSSASSTSSTSASSSTAYVNPFIDPSTGRMWTLPNSMFATAAPSSAPPHPSTMSAFSNPHPYSNAYGSPSGMSWGPPMFDQKTGMPLNNGSNSLRIIPRMVKAVAADVTSASSDAEKAQLLTSISLGKFDKTILDDIRKDMAVLWDSKDLKTIAKEMFQGFGMFNSHVYRKKFMRLAKMHGLSASQVTVIVSMFTAVKNKERVLTAMQTFAAEPWYAVVRSFIEKYIVQYTKEQTNNTFPAVNITSMNPTLTAQCWKYMNPTGTFREFLKNTWASQMSMDASCKAIQKENEIEFWTSIMISKNTMETVEELGFHDKYWCTKAKDMYPFQMNDGSFIGVKDDTQFNVWMADQI